MKIRNVIFQRDIFCDPIPHYRALLPEEEKKLDLLIKREFPRLIGVPKSIEQSGSMEINSNNFRVHGTQGLFLLKKITDISTRSRNSWMERLMLMEEARLAGLPFPRSFRSQSGQSLVEWTNGLWILFEYIEGNHFKDDPRALLHIGRELGKLFSFLKVYRKNQDRFGRRTFFTQKEQKTFSILETKIKKGFLSQRRSFEKALLRYWPILKADYVQTLDCWQKLKNMPLELCHIDIHPRNLLIKHSKVTAFLDIDSVLYSHRIAALGYACFKLLRNIAVGKWPRASMEMIRLRDSFISELVASGALFSEETSRLIWGARLEIMKRFLYIVDEYLSQGYSQWSDFLPVQGNALLEVRDIYAGKM